MTSSYTTKPVQISDMAASYMVVNSCDVTELNTLKGDLAMTEKHLQFDDNGSTVDVRGKTSRHCAMDNLATVYNENQSSSNVPVGRFVNA